MGRGRRKTREHVRQLRRTSARGSPAAKEAAQPGRAPEPPFLRFATRYRSKRTVLRFVASLIVVLGAFHVLLTTRIVRERFLPAYLNLWADASAGVLGYFGETANAGGITVESPRFRMNILLGCDAIDPVSLFVAAVLVSPVPWRRKILGLLLGVSFLLLMNLLRLVSLFYVGVHYPSMFELMHYEVWQVVFILLSILCWGLWAVWAAGPSGPRHALG